MAILTIFNPPMRCLIAVRYLIFDLWQQIVLPISMLQIFTFHAMLVNRIYGNWHLLRLFLTISSRCVQLIFANVFALHFVAFNMLLWAWHLGSSVLRISTCSFAEWLFVAKAYSATCCKAFGRNAMPRKWASCALCSQRGSPLDIAIWSCVSSLSRADGRRFSCIFALKVAL